jgi:hypothetical protein
METHNKPTTPVNAPSFLALPTEIRCEIYKLILTAPLLKLQETRNERERTAAAARISGRAATEVNGNTQSFANSVECSTQFLRVCRQIYDEAFPFFYSHVTVAIENPLEFANSFLFRLDSTKILRLKSLKFRVAGLEGPGWQKSVDRLKTLRFNHMVTVFESYLDLQNLDVFVMETVDRVWWRGDAIRDFNTEYALESSSITIEGNPAPGWINARLWKAGVMLAKGSLRDFKLSRKLICTVITSSSNRLGFRSQEAESVNSLIFRKHSSTVSTC